MCWSGEASFALATSGFVGAAYAAYRKEPVNRYIPLVYFSLMETLQGFTYGWIGQCGNPINYNLTVLSYIHICFQPFLINMFNFSFMSKEEQKRGQWIWWACGVATLTMLGMFAFPDWPSKCVPALQSLCGTQTCSYHGDWHIAWMLELSNLDPHWVTYWLAAFILPMFYGGWRFVIYHFLCGPLLAAFLTTDQNEHPAIWCLLSIGLLLATHVKPLKKLLFSKDALAEYNLKFVR